MIRSSFFSSAASVFKVPAASKSDELPSCRMNFLRDGLTFIWIAFING
jgi:hypothetical protein